MSKSHSPEPWFWSMEWAYDDGTMENAQLYIRDSSGEQIPICHIVSSGHGIGDSDEDARRIAACANACRGISTRELEAMRPFGLANLVAMEH